MSDALKKSKSVPLLKNPINVDWETVTKSYHMIWETRFDEAEELMRETYNNNIWHMFPYVEACLWKWNFGEKKEDEEELERRLELAEKMAETLQSKNKPDSGAFKNVEQNKQKLSNYLDGLIANAYTYLCFSILRFRQESYVKGGYDLRKSWVFFKDANEFAEKLIANKFEIDPKVNGLLHFGLGMFHFMVSIIPPKFMWIMKLLGFEPDRIHSEVELLEAKNSGCIKSIEATLLYYGLKRYFSSDEEKADKIMVKLHKKYPKSPIIAYLYGFVLRMKGEVSDSIDIFNSAKELMKHEQMKIVLHYHLGTSHMLLHKYKKAKKYFQYFLDNNTGKYFRSWACYQIGLCNWFLNVELDQIPELYKNAMKWRKEDDAYDEYAYRKCKEFIKAGNKFPEYETLLLKAQLYHEAKDFKNCIKTLEEAKEKFVEGHKRYKDHLGLYYYFTGSCYKGLKDYDKAKEFFQKAINLEKEVKPEKYSVPHSMVELAEILIEEENFDEANYYLKKAKDMSNYDWQTFLNIYILANMQKIRRLEEEKRNKENEKN